VYRRGGALAPAASSGDALVEAVEPRTDRDLFWLGLQWHPELLDDLRPYRALARAAERYLCL
jgi:gamma-glutamyl-gamma-aminobutyrate hydrolase PuuD